MERCLREFCQCRSCVAPKRDEQGVYQISSVSYAGRVKVSDQHTNLNVKRIPLVYGQSTMGEYVLFMVFGWNP